MLCITLFRFVDVRVSLLEYHHVILYSFHRNWLQKYGT
jgi:hypothetical protein